MHLYKTNRLRSWRGLIITGVLFLAILAVVMGLLGRTDAGADEEQLALLETAIRKAAVTNYAIEGRYPATLDQIVEQYGVIIDYDRYIVRYDIFADNMMPDIYVVFKGDSAK